MTSTQQSAPVVVVPVEQQIPQQQLSSVEDSAAIVSSNNNNNFNDTDFVYRGEKDQRKSVNFLRGNGVETINPESIHQNRQISSSVNWND